MIWSLPYKKIIGVKFCRDVFKKTASKLRFISRSYQISIIILIKMVIFEFSLWFTMVQTIRQNLVIGFNSNFLNMLIAKINLLITHQERFRNEPFLIQKRARNENLIRFCDIFCFPKISKKGSNYSLGKFIKSSRNSVVIRKCGELQMPNFTGCLNIAFSAIW
mgnify:CR=1 FL=1